MSRGLPGEEGHRVHTSWTNGTKESGYALCGALAIRCSALEACASPGASSCDKVVTFAWRSLFHSAAKSLADLASKVKGRAKLGCISAILGKSMMLLWRRACKKDLVRQRGL